MSRSVVKAPDAAAVEARKPEPVATRPGLTVTSLANGVAEATVLFAVVAIPLYFSVLTGAGYEADKAVLLRLIGAVAGAAWLASTLTAGRHVTARSSARTGRILTWLVAALLGVYLLSTALSIDPRLSIVGSFDRGEGLWTFAALVCLFVVVATRFRKTEKIDRLVTVILVGSVPATAYGILQQAGVDPVPASGDPSSLAFPVWSTFGQHLFFASYLVMIAPLTAARAWETRDGWRSAVLWTARERTAAVCVLGAAGLFFVFLVAGVQQTPLFALYPLALAGLTVLALIAGGNSGMPTRVTSAAYVLLLAAQILALLFTGARGAWLGFLVSVPVFGILLGRRLNRPRIWQSLTAATVLIGAFLVLLNIPNGPLQPLRTVKGFSRLADITGEGGTQGSAQGRVLIWHGVTKLMSETPGIGSTAGGAFRDLIGYGPESLAWSFQRVFPLELRRVTAEIWTWDRAHDIFLNYFAELGAAGLVLILAILVVYIARVVRGLSGPQPRPLLLIALASAMAGHIVDGIFGLEMGVTLLFFWLFVGIVAAVPWSTASPEPAASNVPPTDQNPPPMDAFFLPVIVGGLAAALLVVLVPAVESPAVLAGIIVVSTLVGIGVIAVALNPELTRLHIVVPRPAIAVLVTAALLAALGSGAVWQVERGALADRLSGGELAAGHTGAGIGDLQEAVNADPTEPRFSSDLADAYLAFAATRVGSGETVPIGPDSYRTMDPAQILLLGRSELFQLTRQTMRSTLALTPLDPEAWNNLGLLDRTQHRYGAALAAFRRAESLSTQNPRYLDEEALTYLQNGNVDQAMAVAQQAEALDTGYWYSHYAMALAAHHAGNRPVAQREANLAITDVAATWPPPPQSQIQAMQQIAQTG